MTNTYLVAQTITHLLGHNVFLEDFITCTSFHNYVRGTNKIYNFPAVWVVHRHFILLRMLNFIFRH